MTPLAPVIPTMIRIAVTFGSQEEAAGRADGKRATTATMNRAPLLDPAKVEPPRIQHDAHRDRRNDEHDRSQLEDVSRSPQPIAHSHHQRSILIRKELLPDDREIGNETDERPRC